LSLIGKCLPNSGGFDHDLIQRALANPPSFLPYVLGRCIHGGEYQGNKEPTQVIVDSKLHRTTSKRREAYISKPLHATRLHVKTVVVAGGEDCLGTKIKGL
jgi:hypothetical protein